MNKVILSGNLTRDPDIRYGGADGATAVARFSIGVRRRFKDASGEYQSDFPNIIAFGKNAEFAEKYFHQGDRVEIVGRIQTGSYTNKDGVKVYTTDVVADELDFGGAKSNRGENKSATQMSSDEFMSVPDGVDDELPFN